MQLSPLRWFVGRDETCAAFSAAVLAAEPPWVLQFVHGPGGVGKSWLVRRYVELAAAHAALPILIDGRTVEASTAALLGAIESAAIAHHPELASRSGDTPAMLEAINRRCVVLIDTYELLAPLDGWIREHLLNELPGNVMIVLVGRNAPSTEWRAHPEWNGLLQPLGLRNLEPAHSVAYLRSRGVPDQHHDAALQFTRGHPLALSLLADVYAQRNDMALTSVEDVPDVIKALLDSFVQKVPGPGHRAALEACALVRVLNEALLARMLGIDDAHELFDWLRALSFIDSNRLGLYPHDLAREVIASDVRWRNPDWFATLHKRARAYYVQHTAEAAGYEQQRAIYDFTFLHRYNGVVRQFLDWQENGNVRAEPVVAADVPHIIAAIRVAEGEDAARVATYWLNRAPGESFALRDAMRLAGYLIRVPLHNMNANDRAADELAARAAGILDTGAALRQGEVAAMFRFWGALPAAGMAEKSHQAVGTVQSLIFVLAVQYYLSTTRLAATFFCCTEPEFWSSLFAYADLERLSELDGVSNGRATGVYFHDWRIRPPSAWLDLLAERELAVAPAAAPVFRQQTQLFALSEVVFRDALRDAAKNMSRSGGLRGNPLLGSRMVLDAAGGQAATEAGRAETLRKLILEALASLEQNAKEAKLHRAFYHTYVKPAASQELAAEIIDVPFSTYRRHLQSALDRITATLWQKELGE